MIANDATTHRILIVDDTQSIHDDFRKTLAISQNTSELDAAEAALFGEAPAQTTTHSAAEFAIDSAMQGDEAYQKVREAIEAGTPYSLAFVDMRMPPGWDGLKTIEHLWDADPNLQVVICTAYSDYSLDQITQRLGVSDRLLVLKKPFDRVEVTQTAIALTEKWRLSKQAKLKVEQLEHLVQMRTEELRKAAEKDQLTGLANRREFDRRLADAFGLEHTELAVLFLDFDRFKIINDSLGHGAGDLLLIEIARRIEAVLATWARDTQTPEPMAARIGGDEYVVLLTTAVCRETLQDLGQRLLDTLRKPYHLVGHEVITTASIGITTSASASDPEEMVRQADTAMYCAKQAGRDRCVLFDESMKQQSLEQLELETALRKAIEKEELVVYYQPIVCNTTGKTSGFEALVRWPRENGELVSPACFIPLAEETGLIVPLGKWVLRAAATQLRDWLHNDPAAPQDLYMSINLSKGQLLQPGFVTELRTLIDELTLAPASIQLEVTESMVMQNPELITSVLKQIKDVGVRLAMDDFGTGHSSLTCLHRFPIDTVKIDRAFMMNMEKGYQYAALVQAIVTLADNLGMNVVAEGVESHAQLAQVQALDCDYSQGYLFSKPVPVDQVHFGQALEQLELAS